MKRPLIMGVVNVTPDSFSDGGRYVSVDAAIAHGLHLAADGADVLDIGGESTRPGASPVDSDTELNRVIPVIAGLRDAGVTISISIDTSKARVAEAALSAGANIVNDVTAGRADADMFSVVAAASCPYIMMHMLGEPGTMQDSPSYSNVVMEIRAYLSERISAARDAGISDIIIDPGIGFGKSVEHNLRLLAHVEEFAALGVPVLLGISRKRFLGAITGVEAPADRDAVTMMMHALLADKPVDIIRVHNVRMAHYVFALKSALHSAS